MTNEVLSQLEILIDTHGLTDLLSALSGICHEKAEHVQNVWQDKESAKCWLQDARTLDKASEKVNH